MKVNAASFDLGRWNVELAQVATGQAGDVQAIALATGGISLMLVRLDQASRFQIVTSRRALSGSWSTPAVIRIGQAGTMLLRTSHAAGDGGSAMAIWSESADGSQSPVLLPQTLYSSQYDPLLGAWSAPAVVDAGQFYFAPAVASVGSGRWVAAWLSGDASATPALVTKRFDAGTWSAATDRIDTGQDDRLLELRLIARNHRVSAGWTGQAMDASSASVRAAALDAMTGRWSAPSLLGATHGLPVGLELKTDGTGFVAAVCQSPKPRADPL